MSDAVPRIEHRDAIPFLGLTVETDMTRLAPDVLGAGERLAAAMRSAGITRDGPPFWRYLDVDMDRRLVVTVGFPVVSAADVEGAESGELPAGDYAVVEVTGHPDGLADATGALLAWGAAHGHTWDADGVRWASRLEEYLSDPVEVSDMDHWVTRLAIKVLPTRD